MKDAVRDPQTEPGAAAVFLDFVCLVLSVYLLLRWLGVKSIGKMTVIFSFVALGWESLMVEVVNGQLEMILMVLFLGMWLSHIKEEGSTQRVLAGRLDVDKINRLAYPPLLPFQTELEIHTRGIRIFRHIEYWRSTDHWI